MNSVAAAAKSPTNRPISNIDSVEPKVLMTASPDASKA
jgi:hypothetical protein